MKIMVKHIVMCLLVTVIYSYNNVVIYDELMEKTGEFHFIFKIVGLFFVSQKNVILNYIYREKFG